MTDQQRLFEKLARELMQTETSAMVHPRREAARLLGTPLAEALLAVAAHAERSLASMPSSLRQQPDTGLGKHLGVMLSNLRQVVIDRVVDRERSYRGTVMGIHHGIDLVRLMVPLAKLRGELPLVAWFEQWLDERRPLVERAVDQLAWFAENPKQACERGTKPLLAALGTGAAPASLLPLLKTDRGRGRDQPGR
jgi:hypothetical protein